MKLKLPFDYDKLGLRTREEKKRFHRIVGGGVLFGMLVGANIVAAGLWKYTVAIVGVALLLGEWYTRKFLYPMPPDDE